MTFNSRIFRTSATVAATVSVALASAAVVAAPASAALPTVPDSVFPQVTEDPDVTVTFEDGTPRHRQHRGAPGRCPAGAR